MTQFASTLYPQTNPTNPVLLEFRSNGGKNVHWTDFLIEPSDAQKEHAFRVMSRLRSANFTD